MKILPQMYLQTMKTSLNFGGENEKKSPKLERARTRTYAGTHSAGLATWRTYAYRSQHIAVC